MWNARPKFKNMFQHKVMGVEGRVPKQSYITGIINWSRHLETQRLSTLTLRSVVTWPRLATLGLESAAPGSRKSPLRHLDRLEKQKGQLWQLVFLHNCSADREREGEKGEGKGEGGKEGEERRREREKKRGREKAGGGIPEPLENGWLGPRTGLSSHLSRTQGSGTGDTPAIRSPTLVCGLGLYREAAADPSFRLAVIHAFVWSWLCVVWAVAICVPCQRPCRPVS